ncbi:NAD-dependent epimerase/dehydratase family protein [Candidatus Latescibacterota bacterium]
MRFHLRADEGARMKLRRRYTRALVTGGAGFIGSHLVEELLKEGLEVVSVDSYVAGKKENLAHVREHKGLREVECDVVDSRGLERCFEGVDIVFHEAASKMTVCLRDPPQDLDVNARGALNVLELARKHGVKKVVHASTGSVYGEAQYYPTDEEHPVNPTSYYGVSKLAGEKYARVFSHLYGMDVSILRYFHVFGPRQESSDVGGVVSIFARRALHDQPLRIYGDGTQLRTFTFVKDLVEINKTVAMQGGRGEAYNCASDARVTILELAEGVLDHYGKRDLEIEFHEWRPGDIRKFDVSNAKIKSLGYEFQTKFPDGLAKTLEWSRAYFSR